MDVTQPEPWNLVAHGYAETAAAHFEPYAIAALRLAKVARGEHVLDVATGPGTLALPAAAIARVTALDFSSQMIERVRTRAARRGVELETRVGDGQDLPFPDACFDVAFSMFGLFLFPDRQAGFRELARVLRPGGRAVVGSWVPRDAAHPFTRAGALLRTGEAAPLDDGATPAMPLSDPAEIRDEMGAAGFEVTVERFEHVLRFASADALASEMLRSHVGFMMAKKNTDPTSFDSLAAQLRTVLADTLGAGPVEVPLAAWLGYGVRR
ncbi:MAG: methyltransferase domain-containing protein [Myxococcota bacterium]